MIHIKSNLVVSLVQTNQMTAEEKK
uniref:Uncharacterized protein n=1 Tax=Anguilla anguilla TaxID=7936 RepID=A0A0E9X876_ANGAN